MEEEKELTLKKDKSYTVYTFHDNYVTGCLKDGTLFYVDVEDFELIKDYNWYKVKDGYICAEIKDENKKKKRISMHRLIMNYPEGLLVDHINHNTSDNRKSNLRIVTRAQNTMNQKKMVTNKSGVIGVFWRKDAHKWQATIKINGKTRHLGYYEKLEDAALARKKAEEELFGEYSYFNSMKQGEKNAIEKL